jgi:hypothetical protein
LNHRLFGKITVLRNLFKWFSFFRHFLISVFTSSN